MTARRNVTNAPRIRRQAADPKVRLTEVWHCAVGHEFGFDPDKCNTRPKRCPVIVGQSSSGAVPRWLGCTAAVQRVRGAGVVRDA